MESAMRESWFEINAWDFYEFLTRAHNGEEPDELYLEAIEDIKCWVEFNLEDEF